MPDVFGYLAEGLAVWREVADESETLFFRGSIVVLWLFAVSGPVFLALAAAAGAVGAWGFLTLLMPVALFWWLTSEPEPETRLQVGLRVLAFSVPAVLLGVAAYLLGPWGAFGAWWQWLIGHLQ